MRGRHAVPIRIMNDNNDLQHSFSWFYFAIIGCRFSHSELPIGTNSSDQNKQPLISKQNHEEEKPVAQSLFSKHPIIKMFLSFILLDTRKWLPVII